MRGDSALRGLRKREAFCKPPPASECLEFMESHPPDREGALDSRNLCSARMLCRLDKDIITYNATISACGQGFPTALTVSTTWLSNMYTSPLPSCFYMQHACASFTVSTTDTSCSPFRVILAWRDRHDSNSQGARWELALGILMLAHAQHLKPTVAFSFSCNCRGQVG